MKKERKLHLFLFMLSHVLSRKFQITHVTHICVGIFGSGQARRSIRFRFSFVARPLSRRCCGLSKGGTLSLLGSLSVVSAVSDTQSLDPLIHWGLHSDDILIILSLLATIL